MKGTAAEKHKGKQDMFLKWNDSSHIIIAMYIKKKGLNKLEIFR